MPNATSLRRRRTPTVSAWPVAVLILGLAGCQESNSVLGPDGAGLRLLTATIVSNSVINPDALGTTGDVAFVSLPPGAEPRSEVATITNLRTGATATVATAGGGFDPVRVAAEPGDSLRVRLRIAGSATPATATLAVPPRKGILVVRTDPPPQKRDVPLNASFFVVFSEPVDPASVSAGSVEVLRDGVRIDGTASLLADSPWIVAFTPARPLAPETGYQLVVTTGIRDLDGESLEAPVRVPFTTGSSAESRIAFVSSRDAAGPWPSDSSIPYIFVATAEGSGVRRLTRGLAPAWSPDGSKLAFYTHRSGRFESDREMEIRVINADGSGARTLGPGVNPAWSPDGQRIAFNRTDAAGGEGIFAMNADGSSPVQLLSSAFVPPLPGYVASAYWPSWSPDGKQISFVRTAFEETWGLYVVKADGSDPREVPGVGIAGSRPVWSPDGSTLLYMSDHSVINGQHYWGVSSVSPAGSNYRNYLMARWVQDPDWSPDGIHVAFSGPSMPGDAANPLGTRLRIFVLNVADGSMRQLIPDAIAPAFPGYRDYGVAWSRLRP